MMTEIESKRTLQTKRSFMDAFIELNRSRMIDKISIKELCNRVWFNRGTFYLHFHDIYDLREQIENELLRDMKDIFCELGDIGTQTIKTDKAKKVFNKMLEYVKAHHLYFEALTGSTGDISFIDKMKENIKLMLHDNLLLGVNEKQIEKDRYEFILEYGLSANMGIITYWIKNGMKMPINELVALFNELMYNGLANDGFTPQEFNSIIKENNMDVKS